MKFFERFSLLAPPISSNEIFSPLPESRNEIVRDWLKLIPAWVKTLRHLLFRKSIIVRVD